MNPEDIDETPKAKTATDEFCERLRGQWRATFEALSDEDKGRVMDLASKHKRVHFDFLEEHGLVVYKKPGRKEARRYMRDLPVDENAGTDMVMTAADNLCLSCCVYPGPGPLNSILDDLPNHSVIAARHINDLGAGKSLGK